MRLVAITLVASLVACRGDAPASDPGAAAPAPPPKPALALPQVDGQALVLADAHPAALVWVDRTGQLATGTTGPRWSGDPFATKRDPIAEPANLRLAVLAAIVASGGAGAAEAQIDLADLQENPPHAAGPDAIARQRALDQARRAGIVDSSAFGPVVKRLPSARAIPVSTIEPTTPLVLADPDAPGSSLARALVDTGGAVAVSDRGQLAALDRAFELTVEPAPAGEWVEAYLDTAGIHFVVVPLGTESDVPRVAGAIDGDQLRLALERIQSSSGSRPIDLLIGVGISSQAMIDMVRALDHLGVHELSIGDTTTTVEQRRYEIAAARPIPSSVPRISLDPPELSPGLGKTAIRATLHQKIEQIRTCYERQLLVNPDLHGTVHASFFITPNGTVSNATADGVDDKVSGCVADTLRSLRFPKRRGRGVQVNYPFTFTPAH
jgi:hypothetical protein